MTAADGVTRLDAALYRPAEPAATPPPCVVWVYGGPHAQYVKNAWEMTVSPLRQYLAQSGVAVLVVDNRGSNFRGLAFEAPLAGHLGSVEIADQCAAVEQLAAAGEIDGSRVAITGGSYGGFMTLMSVIRRPDVFRCGVAIAPVTDQRGYDTAYIERYLGHPTDEPEAYARSSVLPHADDLNGSVLVIHGAIDENVHLRHSIRLAAAVQARGRDLELVVLPDDRHRVRSPQRPPHPGPPHGAAPAPGPGRRSAGRIRNLRRARRCREAYRHTESLSCDVVWPSRPPAPPSSA